MKKRIALLMALAIGSVCVFSGCNGGSKESITVFNYGMYIDPEILDDFTNNINLNTAGISLVVEKK